MAAKLMIFTNGQNLWYKSTSAKSSDLNRNPVGKGSGYKKPKVPVKTRASAKSAPEIINPIFDQMSKVTSDPFWKTSFNEAAIGKFNRGFRFNNDVLTYKARNKATLCKIGGMELLEAMETVQLFMRTTAGIVSAMDAKIRDKELKRIASENVEASSGTTSWSQIRSINNQTTLVINYVVTLGETLNLTEREEDKLINLIMIGIVNKRFNSTNIIMFNSIIHRIDGLIRNCAGEFLINPDICPPINYSKISDEEEEVDTSNANVRFDVVKDWTKFVKDLAKRHPSNNPRSFTIPEPGTPYDYTDISPVTAIYTPNTSISV